LDVRVLTARKDPALFAAPACFALAVLVVCLPLASAERLPINVYTTTDGLASHVVTRIVTDSHGILWLCTREGLSRFDGYEFSSFNLRDGLPSATVNDVLEARDGRYWVATTRGLVWFRPFDIAPREPLFHSVLPSQPQASLNVTSLLQDAEGTLWVGTEDGIALLATTAAQGDRLIELEPRGVEITRLHSDTRSSLWIGTNAGLYRRTKDGELVRFSVRDGLPEDFVQSLLTDADGSVWVGTRLAGLVRIVEEHGRLHVIEAYRRGDGGFPSDWIGDLMRSTDGRIWVGTPGGLVACVPAKQGSCQARTYTAAHGLPRGGVTALAEDRRHQVWIGSPMGVARILAADITIFDDADGTPTAATLMESPAGDVVAMDAGGDVRLSRYSNHHFVSGSLPPSVAASSWGWNQLVLVDRSGDWWIGTRNGLLRFHGITRAEDIAHVHPRARYTRRDGLASDVIMRLFEDSRGDIWIGTAGEGKPNGLSRWSDSTHTFESFGGERGLPSLTQFYVSAFAEDRGGRLWIGFSGEGGLVRYHAGRFERFGPPDGLPSGSIRNMLIDRDGRLWAASYTSGLLRCDSPGADRPMFSAYSTTSGLSSNEVTAVVDDRRGWIYAATALGIDRLHVQSGRVDRFRAGQGIPFGETHAALCDRTGVLWFASNGGVIRLAPTPRLPASPPEVLITAVNVAGRRLSPRAPGGQSASSFMNGSGPIEIRYVSPGFHLDDGLLYQIRLQGAETEWGVPTTQRSIVYGNLAPGSYRFEVRAIAMDGTHSAVVGFPFDVMPPLWRRWSVLSLALGCLIAGGYVLHRRRVARLMAIANLRTRIATDLHDDIGANLTRIAVLSEVVRAKHHTSGTLDDHLESMAAVARESVAAMGDIVWAINPDRDTLADLRRRMIAYGEDVLSCGDCGFVMDADDLRDDTRISVDLRRDVYLIFKEALNNAARHARCSEVRVSLSSNSSRLYLSIDDDGVGWHGAPGGEGNGLVNMERRAARMGGTLRVRSTPGGGTTVALDVPLAG